MLNLIKYFLGILNVNKIKLLLRLFDNDLIFLIIIS